MADILDDIFNDRYDGFFLIAGPCAVESQSVCDEVAGKMKEICRQLEIPYIFKSSIKKANRTKLESFTGIGDDEALAILRSIGEEHNLPLTTDVHEVDDIKKVYDVVDLIQIPAFLCRQTDLLVAAGRTGKAVNVKKGQFMSGEAMTHAISKVTSTDNHRVMVTERGNSFGYGDLIVDGRNIEAMSGHAVTIMDVTHATQRPNQSSGISGGNPSEIELLGRIGLSAGAKGIFMEAHPDPDAALSDGASMMRLDDVGSILERWKALSVSIRSIYG